MTRRNHCVRRPLQLRLLSTLPAAFALSALIAGGTALADGPLDAVGSVKSTLGATAQSVTEPVPQAVTKPVSNEPAAKTELPPAVTEAVDQTVAPVTEPVTEAVDQTTTAVTKPVTEAVDQTTTAVTKPVTDAVEQTTTAVTKPVTDAVEQTTTTAVAKPVTEAVKQTTASVTKPVAEAVKQTTAAVTKPVTTAVKQTTTAALKPAAAVVKPAATATKPVTRTVTRVATVTQRVRAAAGSAGDSVRSAGGSITHRQSPARIGPAVGIVRSGVGAVVAESNDLATGSGGLGHDVAATDASALAQGQGHAVTRASLVPERPVAQPSADRGAGLTSSAGSPGTVAHARPSGGGPSPAGMIGLAALLGVLGLGALRSGQIASGLATFGGTGGLRSATQFALMSRWSGRCVPLGGEASANAAFAGRADRTLAGSTGGRGEVKGAISAAIPAGARGGPSPSVALADPPALSRGSESPPAALWGALLAASAAIGALLGHVTGRDRSADDPA